MKINGISVTFGRQVQPAQYESKKAEATISIVPRDDGNELTNDDATVAMELARGQVYGALGMKREPSSLQPSDHPSHDELAKSVTSELQEEKPKRKPAPKEEQIDIEESIEAAKEETGSGDEGVTEEPKAEKTKSAKKDSKVLQSGDLMMAINRKMAEFRDHNVPEPNAILKKFLKDWVNKVMPEDERDKAYQGSVIAQKVVDEERGQEFLDELDAMKV